MQVAGYTATQMKAAGYTATHMKAAGYTARDLIVIWLLLGR
jgi:hypothetical protein